MCFKVKRNYFVLTFYYTDLETGKLELLTWKVRFKTDSACFCSLCLYEFLHLLRFLILHVSMFPLIAGMSLHRAVSNILSICWNDTDLPVIRGTDIAEWNGRYFTGGHYCQMQNFTYYLFCLLNSGAVKLTSYLINFLFSSLIAGSLSTMSVWLLRASSRNNFSSSNSSEKHTMNHHTCYFNNYIINKKKLNSTFWSTCGHIFLYDVLQGIIPEELSKGTVLIEQFLVGAHLWHSAFYQHHDVVHLRQEANAMCH